MRIAISRLSPHQNAKVFAVLMAVGSLVFAVPMFLAFLAIPDGVDGRGNPVHPPPAFIALLFPVGYLIMGYISVRIGCWFYNVMFKYVGGIEYETHEKKET